MLTAVVPRILAFDLPPILGNHLGFWVALLIVLVGLFGIGLSDLIRFSITRIWAISGVCFDESIRRRILWITPLAILGVLAVTQLQKASDEQDAIRQTTKFCLFATGLVVVISVIVLACSNLPREIENRVIFTVVTKPTTRLEIVLGKILGFARVSAMILLIMGLFTWGYLHLRAYQLQRDIHERLAVGAVEAISRPTLEHYVDPNGPGLLNARTLATPSSIQVYAKAPTPGDPRRWFASNGDGGVFLPFDLPNDALLRASNAPQDAPAMVVHLVIGYERIGTQTPTPGTPAGPSATSRPLSGPAPLVSSTRPTSAIATTEVEPKVIIGLYDNEQNSFGAQINGGQPFTLSSPNGSPVDFALPVSVVAPLAKVPTFFISVSGQGNNFIYSIDPATVKVQIARANSPTPAELRVADLENSGAVGTGLFKGRSETYGQDLRGGEPGTAPYCDFHFDQASISTGGDPTVPVELRVTLQKGDQPSGTDVPTTVQLQVLRRDTGKLYDAGVVHPENNRVVYGNLPAESVSGGNFDILMRCTSPGDYIGFKGNSLYVVGGENSFVFNLFKSLLVIWLLAVLVIAIAIFCSTFLSWPIAVVLTLVLLLGRWGVQELGDAASAGLGRQFVQDFGVRDPASAQALSTTVEQLNKVLTTIAVVLPDIDKFSATDEIERGVNISAFTILNAVGVLVGFGTPLTVLAYVFLKNKEVAP